ncbi:MAG: prepilin-type N-terminal cleavage/methylation domain-containing protein [bacterium]|nr:prepilin-type N-terminal cleavage/methylation domain-containing protein [bacterium]
MIHSKNSSGFLLIEVLISIAIIGILVTPLFILQGTVFQQVSQMSQRLHRLFFAEHFLIETRRSVQDDVRQFTLEKKEENPATVLNYTVGPLEKKSSLATIPGLLLERVVIQEPKKKPPSVDTIVTFLFKPEQKKK